MGGGGYGTSESVFELSSKWLLEPELANKVKGIMVLVRGSAPQYGNPWHNGDCEDKQGVVLSVLDTQNDSFKSTARVRFLEPVNPLQPILAVPVNYLWPVHPKLKGEDVIILSGSQGKGQEARVEAIETTNLMVLTTKATFLVIDSSPDKLVRVKQVDEVGNFIR